MLTILYFAESMYFRLLAAGAGSVLLFAIVKRADILLLFSCKPFVSSYL